MTLFVTYCHFLRPHTSLTYRVPIELTELEGITTLQAKWAKALSLAGKGVTSLQLSKNM